MNEMELMMRLHRTNKRQGPGGERETLLALSLCNIMDNRPLKVADIGCGTGDQTITLAKNLNAEIIAVDLFQEFLDQLNENATKIGLSSKIKTLQASMDKLPFDKDSFDLIWSEGAIYNIGFTKGLKLWKPYLKKGGMIALSEISWITESRPKELEDFWVNAYPEIDTVSNKIKILNEIGYSVIGHFVLPPKCWLDNYYLPLENRHADFLNETDYSLDAQTIVQMDKEEIMMYKKYKDYYSYGFYIAYKK